MNDSFTTSTLTKPPTTKKKYPTQTPPNDTWTIEQLLHWSLDQYHSAAISRTNSHLEALQAQCENECEDVMTLHELAVGMRERGELNNNDDNEEQVESREEENADPQQQQLVDGDYNSSNHLKPTSTSAAATNSTNTSKPKSTTNTSTLTITILTGPHESQTYKLQPKHTQPCLIGRSKGKKFLRNGISLSKDQEVSTTHGKFSIEQQEQVDNDSSSNSGGVQNKFYYTDVGSTNGSTVGEARLEPNVRIEIEEGMDLRVGNSALKIEFG